jgi:hypothetical protein
MNMKVKQYLLTALLFVLAHFCQAHDLEPLHVDGRYLKNPAGDIVTLHGILNTPEHGFTWVEWNGFDYDTCLKGKKIAIDSVLAAGWKIDYVRLHLDQTWCADFKAYNEEQDTKNFQFDRFKKYFELFFIPLMDYFHSKGLYTVLLPPLAAELLEMGSEIQQKQILFWEYVSSHPHIKNNPGVMFELANEPLNFHGNQDNNYDGLNGFAKNQSTVFKGVRDYWQPIVDIIRENCTNIIYVPGLLYQSDHAGFAEYPIKGNNIGYAVHWYPGWWGNMRKDWEDHVFPIAYHAPIIITETAWYGEGEGTTTKFGKPLKDIIDGLGNVSWNCFEPGEDAYFMVNQPSTITWHNDPEACIVPMYQWWNEYAKTKVIPTSNLRATSVSFDEFPTTVPRGKMWLAKIRAQFSNGQAWDVSGDAEYTVSDENVLTINHGVIRALKEGTATVGVTYTDGTGQTFNRSFEVTSTLFPLTAKGFKFFDDEGSFDEASCTYTLNGYGRGGWSFNDGIDLSSYKYLVFQLNQPEQCWAAVSLWDQVELYGHLSESFGFAGGTELVINLQSLNSENGERMDMSHIYGVGIWINCEADPAGVSIKRVFLSNDGTTPASYVEGSCVYADNKVWRYGDEIPQLTYSTAGSALNGTPQLSTTATGTSELGTFDIIVEQGSVTNERVKYYDGTLTPTKALLTVGVEDVTITKGDAIPTFTLTYDGLRNGDTADEILSEQPTATTTATKDSSVGNYDITISGGKATNYELAWHNGTLTITPDATMTLPADRTAKVATNTEAWDAWGECSTEYTPAVTTADGRVAPMVERYEETVTTTGTMMEQTVTGLELGEYIVSLCANAYYTDGRGFDSDLKEGAKDVVRLYANDVQQSMTAHIGTSTNKNDEYTLSNVKVIDGSLHIGMEALKPGTNWHTLQIKSLKLTKQYTLSEAFNIALEEANKLLPQRMSDRARNTLLKSMAAEQTYPNYYRLADALQQAHESIEAQEFARRALEVWKNELLIATNVCTPEAKVFYQQSYLEFHNAYDGEWLGDERASNELYNPYEGGGGKAYWDLLGFLTSVWEYNMDNTPYMDGAPYSVSWCIPMPDDGTGFVKPYMEYRPSEDNHTLDARALTATMTDMEPGQYTVKAHVRLHSNDGKGPKGITLQVCNGSPVAISGQRIGETDDYIDHYTATGTVGSDGVLTIKFIVAADNNVDWLAFRDLWQFPSKNIGDANSDGKVDYEDVKAIARYIIGQTPANFNKGAADVSGDGRVNIADGVALIKLIK